MNDSAVFNDLVQQTAEDLKPFAKAIAVMKDLRYNWGPDDQGRIFEFQLCRLPWLDNQTVIVATYTNKAEMQDDDVKKAALLVGMPSEDEPCDFTARLGWYRKNNSDPVEITNQVIMNRSIKIPCTPDNADKPVKRFVEMHMNKHPRYQQAMQAAAAQVIDGIPPVSPV